MESKKVSLIENLRRIVSIKRERHHPLIHEVHKRHGISRKTLFYVKEYGPHSNVPKVIVKESIKILLFASIISSFGGLAIEYIKTIFISLVPLLVLLPTLNDMIGDYGTIISARFSTMLHSGKARKGAKNSELNKLLHQVLIVGVITSLISFLIALIISSMLDYRIRLLTAIKIFFAVIIDVVLLISILFLIAVFAGFYYYKKGEDPNNFLIPITTSIADFGNMIILAALVILLF